MSVVLLTLFVRRPKVFNVDFSNLREIIKKNFVGSEKVRTFALLLRRTAEVEVCLQRKLPKRGHQESNNAEWSSQLARLAHNQEVAGAEPAPATKPIEWQHN